MLPFRALIFDLDGTLADSLEDIADAMNGALAAHGLPTHEVPSYRYKVGDGIEWLVRRAMPQPCPVPLPQLMEEYRTRYKATGHAKTQAYPGIAEMLDGVAALEVPMAVLSNKRDDFTKELVRLRFGRWRFAAVAGEREGVPRKPDPTSALELARVLGFAPSQLGFVGDTPIDMNTARNAGMTPIGVLWGFRTREELLAAGAKHVLERPAQLLELS